MSPVDGRQESLADRIARGPLPMMEALQYAITIAGSLRELHAQGLVYGAVCSQLILLGPAGAMLRPPGGPARLGDTRQDVTDFGAMWHEIFLRKVSAEDRQRQVCEDARALLLHSREEAPAIQQTLAGLRILRIQTRQAAVERRPAWARAL